MPAYKDLYDMVRRTIEAEMKEMEEMVERLSNEVKEAIERESCLTPLYTELKTEREAIYIIDVPYLKAETIYVRVDQQNLQLSCNDSRGFKYKLSLRIPKEFEGSEVNLTRNRGRIVLRLTKKS
ncbi:hypothetical protein [Metallosphaera hakonensis]|uniref:Hsp20/alpha crystallin family protein n=1 Tax=Metallosphaera hakonensis JCM 8857 = DSM 7519 TaxID=1293036 RepID=A0A2U9IVK5_9CREN|nr:hypothetical protein [Metallosphaera hakonensis]AWS00024.1 hypothetical protein DFR87_10380 [Metallosphaera hakonensis JCM 8857 = DSM 7519]